MKPKLVALLTITAALSGCGGTWIDTSAGTCTNEQIEEASKNPEMFNAMGNSACQEKGKGEFMGDFRCTGSEENGTRKLQAKCKG